MWVNGQSWKKDGRFGDGRERDNKRRDILVTISDMLVLAKGNTFLLAGDDYFVWVQYESKTVTQIFFFSTEEKTLDTSTSKSNNTTPVEQSYKNTAILIPRLLNQGSEEP